MSHRVNHQNVTQTYLVAYVVSTSENRTGFFLLFISKRTDNAQPLNGKVNVLAGFQDLRMPWWRILPKLRPAFRIVKIKFMFPPNEHASQMTINWKSHFNGCGRFTSLWRSYCHAFGLCWFLSFSTLFWSISDLIFWLEADWRVCWPKLPRKTDVNLAMFNWH